MRAVFDTNVVISALLFDGRLAWLRAAWSDGRLTPVVNGTAAAELRRVLSYPKFRLNEARQRALLEEYLARAEFRRQPTPIPPWAEARADKYDVIFLALAASEAVPLLTGDRLVAALEGKLPVLVLPPHALLSGWGA